MQTDFMQISETNPAIPAIALTCVVKDPLCAWRREPMGRNIE